MKTKSKNLFYISYVIDSTCALILPALAGKSMGSLSRRYD